MTTAFAIYLAFGAVLAGEAMCSVERERLPHCVTLRYFASCVVAALAVSVLWGPFAIAYLLGDRDV